MGRAPIVEQVVESNPSHDKLRGRWRWRSEKMAWKAAEIEQRGYAIKWGYVAIAYAGELLIIATSLAGSWLFAEMYWDGDSTQFWFMMLAPITYAAVELVRVPLAIMARVQRSFILKMLAFTGIVLAAGVTTKSLSQLGEMMFHPRLIETTKARDVIVQAKAERASLDQRIADADAQVAEQAKALQEIDKRAMETVQALSAMGGPKCMEVSGTSKNGKRFKTMKCATDNRNEVIAGALAGTKAERPEIERKLEEARKVRAGLDRDVSDRKIADAEAAYRQAVLRSQLHSFTAMVYGEEPTQVSDAQVHSFLRLFVFLPAICAAFASTLLAFCSVHIPKRLKASSTPSVGSIAIPQGAEAYWLGPLAQTIQQRVTEELRMPAVQPTAQPQAAHNTPPFTVVQAVS